MENEVRLGQNFNFYHSDANDVTADESLSIVASVSRIPVRLPRWGWGGGGGVKGEHQQ